jgi:hypothetical protein
MDETPHPLAQTLATLLRRTRSSAPRFAVVLGAGSGRNLPPLIGADVHVDLIEPDPARAQAVAARFDREPLLRVIRAEYTDASVFAHEYVAALSTHALLHGTAEHIAAMIGALAGVMAPDADLFLTFGSTSDPRFGKGTRIAAATWASPDGPEAGVPHTYFDEGTLRTLLRAFDIISLDETPARELVGSWAHDDSQNTPGIVHWFAHAKASEF